MSELHKFLFDGLPVRGAMVRLTDAWTELLRRRAGNSETGPYPAPVAELLGEMAAAGVLMQSHIKFNGALVLQIFGDGPVKLAVAEVRSNLALRATATISSANGPLDASAHLPELVNVQGQGRCAITLDPQDRLPGQQPYQGVVPLNDAQGHKLTQLSDMLMQYMRQSEQLDATLVLAANDQVAAGLLIQRMPVQGQGNLAGGGLASDEARAQEDEDYRRIALLAASLTREELLTLDPPTLLHRLFWEEKLLRFEPQQGATGPHFACTCSRQRVATMLRSLGQPEVQSIIDERNSVEVGCDFCGRQYQFDKVDAAQLFTEPDKQPPAPRGMQ